MSGQSQLLTFRATFTSVHRKADRSVKATCVSSLELSPEDLMILDTAVPVEGYFGFKTDGPFVLADVPLITSPPEYPMPAKDGPRKGVSWSQHQRAILWHIWDKTTDKSMTKEQHYEMRERRICQALMAELPSMREEDF